MVGLTTLTGAGIAEAAAHPVGISPITDVVARAPLAVSVTFDRPLRADGAKLRVIGATGDVGQGTVTTDSKTLRRRLKLGAPAGDYRVEWKAISADGYRMAGSFEFTAARGNQDPAPGAVSHPGQTSNVSPASGYPGPTQQPTSTGQVIPSTGAGTQTAIGGSDYTIGAAAPASSTKPPADKGVSSGFTAVPLVVGALLVIAAGVVSALNRRRAHV